MSAQNAKQALQHCFESLADGFENQQRDFHAPSVPEILRTSNRKISDKDEEVLAEIYEKAQEGITDVGCSGTVSDELSSNCQICLDERWSELSCDYDEAVAWLREVLGLSN